MAASAADVRSILGLATPEAAAAAKRKAAAAQVARRGEQSITRELNALIGPGGAPSLAIQRAPKPRLKAKPKLGGGGGVVKWWVVVTYYNRLKELKLSQTRRERREFTNNARGDGLQLAHWVKVESDPAQGMRTHTFAL
jgi:DNA methyltransferase 1-associated protein 1